MGNIYIPPNNNKMLQQLESELEHHTENLLIILGDFNARHAAWDYNIKNTNRNREILADLISRHNLENHNDGINIFTHLNGSSITDLVLSRNSNIRCQTKNLDLISNCNKGIETNLVQQTIIINNNRYKAKGADWKKCENDITLFLSVKAFRKSQTLALNQVLIILLLN